VIGTLGNEWLGMSAWKEPGFEDPCVWMETRTVTNVKKRRIVNLEGRTSVSLIDLPLPASLLRLWAGAGRLVQLEGGPDRGVDLCLDLASKGDSGPLPGVLGSCRHTDVLVESVLEEREFIPRSS
jgi:hypothetical protein